VARLRAALPPDTDLVPWLLSLPPEQWAEAVDQLGETERDALDRDWASWSHRGQQPPATCPDGSPWRSWVIMAGRGFGKTLAGAKWLTARIAEQAEADAEPPAIALVGATLAEARAVMVEGRSGLLEVADAWITDWQPSLRRLSFRTGAVATLFSGASPEQLRGPEHHLAWCDELAKWEKPKESWDMLQFGLRLGDWPRALITTTPRPGPVLTAILAQPDTVRTGGPTSRNPHLADAWQRAIHGLYAGTRLGRQELDGELLPDAAGALWSAELLASCRIAPSPQRGEGGGEGALTSARQSPAAEPPLSNSLPNGERGFSCLSAREAGDRDGPRYPPFTSPLAKIVIAVDPPAGDGTCGIIACARDEAGQAHILADHSVTGRSPEGWARAVADAVRIHTLLFSCESRSPERNEADVVRIHTLCSGEGRSAGRSESDAADSPTAPASAGARPAPYVVAEANQGGKMVRAVLHTADPKLKVKLVTATVGKAERAAPVAMLFEAGRVVLHGVFPELEAEMLGMIAGGDYQGPGDSPDRADAMVWGLTELMLQPERAPPTVRGL